MKFSKLFFFTSQLVIVLYTCSENSVHRAQNSAKDNIVFYGGFEDVFNDSTWIKNWGIDYIDRSEGGQVISSDLNGSNTPDLAPRESSYAQFDDFIASKNRIGQIKK